MDRTIDASAFPLDLEGSLDPGQLPEITLRDDRNVTASAMTSFDFDQGYPPMVSKSYSGRLSPGRGRSIKEYDKQISDLKKENFGLKIRIYHMEERMQQRYGDGQDVYKLNVELQVEVDKLKKDLEDKQDLIQRADVAMDTLRSNYRQEEEAMKSSILSEFTENVKNLQAQLENAKKECEIYRKESLDAKEKVEALQQDLNLVNADLCKSNREKDDLADKLWTAEFGVQHLNAQLKLIEQSKSETDKENLAISQQLKDLNGQLQQSQKEISRNKRDLQNISTLLEDHSHIDSTSLLEPVHQQDEMEDALDTIKRKDERLGVLEDSLKQKDNMVGNLEDALRELENRMKDVDAEKKKIEIELEQLRKRDAKINKSYQCTIKTLAHKDTELRGATEKLNTAMDKIKSLEESLKDSELEKAKTIGDLTKELTDLEVDNRRLKLQLVEAEGTAENLAMTLGKKEGELAGFQDQLKKAMDALQSSDDAVEALHNQLKVERSEFDKKLKEEAMKHMMSPGRHAWRYSGSEQFSDSEKMALKQSKEVSALEEELNSLRAELQGKNFRIQTLENSRTFYESHKTVHHFAEKTTEVGELPLDLLTDLKSLLEQLQRDMASLPKLQNLLSQLHNSESGDTASSAELLLTEISSVQKLYRQLEGGVEKNSQLHQALLHSLRGNRRQSDSPDSNSCQDGGFNLMPSDHLEETTPTKQQKHLPAISPGKSVSSNTSPSQVDRSFQTGTALSHSDQGIQTSPRTGITVNGGTSVIETSIRNNLSAKAPSFTDETNQNKSHSNSLLISPGKYPNLVPSHRLRHSHVHFADTGDNLNNKSLTDDAKGINPLSVGSLQNLDLFDCSGAALFDEVNFDLRAHDRASSARFNSQATNSPSQKYSDCSAILSSNSVYSPSSSATKSVPPPTTPTNRGIEFADKNALASKNTSWTTNGHTFEGNDAFEQNETSHKVGDFIDFNNHRSSSFVSPGTKLGQVNVTKAQTQQGKSLVRDPEIEDICEQTDSVSANRLSDRTDQRSRRNSWAEELEQYRVHDQNKGADQQPQDNPSHQEKQVIASMSTTELRDLVAQLQVDLVDAIKENRALHEELKAVPKKQFAVNGHTSAISKGALKSKIPRLHASNSCHSTTSEDSDRVDDGATSAHKETANALHSTPTDSHTMIKNLQDKLHATENTVRLLSKKNKAYVSALESVGISPRILNRSNSESCLSTYADMSQERAALATGLNGIDHSRRLAYLLSPSKNRELSSMETTRAATARMPSFDADLLQPSPLTALAKSPTSTISSCSPVRNTDASASSSASCLQQTQSTTISASQTMNSVDTSEPGVYFKVPAVPSTSSKSTASGSSPQRKNGQVSDGAQQQPDDKSSPNGIHFAGPKANNKSPTLSSPSKDQSSNYNQMSASLIDISAYPDVTYTSLLDGTLLNRLHQMTNMDHSMSTTMNEDMSSMNLDQLQGRLEHLERVNLTLREEINVYEAIHHSQGTQVSPSFSNTAGNGQELPKSDEDLLKQHLVEIKKLRQRLERLDVTKDPEQLLIFQTHTQQRITRQEAMLAHLQQQLVEKEERHLQECAQLQHRLAREKVAVGEQLEQTITDLRKQLEIQAVAIAKREEQIQELKIQLTHAEDREKKQDEEITKIMSEKAELGDDLVKRDKEFLEMEKMMFRLEMAKESSESGCRQMELDLEDKERECTSLKKEIQESKENSKCLKEIVVKREKSLQEKMYSLQKVTNEKISLEENIAEKENQLTKHEEALSNLREEMHDLHSTHDNMKMKLQSEIEELKSDLWKKEERNAFQKAAYEAEVQRLAEEKLQMKDAHEREIDNEQMETRRQVEDLRSQIQDKKQLEAELEMLRERVKTISGLQSKVEKLESQLDHKASRESELQDQLDSLTHLQERFDRNQECLESVQLEKTKNFQDLKEREEKLRKRDKQLKNLIGQHVKLETTFSKQKNMLKEKTELIYSQKKQLRLFEVSLTATSQEEKNDIMKQLLKELIATQRQVEELLSRLEQNPLSQPTVVVETFGVGKATASHAGLTTTVTTRSGAGSSSSSGQDNVDTVLSVGVREGSPEVCLGSLSPSASEGELDVLPSSVVGSRTMASSNSVTSPLRPMSTNHSQLAPLHYPLSPTQLRYYADVDTELTPGKIPQSMVGSDIRSLFAVFKLESHEKLVKMSGESLVVLSAIEARLEDRLRTFKAMAVSESVDYSTIRETSMSCKNLRLCLEEAVKLAALAWITELPPVDARGHFYDPVLAEQNEKLKHDLTLLRSRHDVLDHTVKEQQGRLQASKERHKNWEQSLYKQLHKTAQDMEKAKENFDTAGMVPKRNLSLRVRSPNKSPHKRLDDTL